MRNLIFHGHFYQPPRENPWTGIIGDQSEASPFGNWNEKICREAYEANAYSPLLDKNSLIESFYNNYSHISFNMGPTLLDWLKSHSEHVYCKIIEADRISEEALGQGNALAQVYNHIILPLASEKDKKTQIYWGLENFRRHFGRDSEGIWLSEAAINMSTAEELVRSGVKYTILSPHQAEKIRFENNNLEESAQYESLLWQKPWTLSTYEGPLTVFFYHPGLSSDISFNHLLRDADYLFNRVCRELDENNAETLSVATDGEIYGHHETLGNMGLSAFLNKVENSEDIRMVNYSWLCSNTEAAGEISLKEGEEARGSSWSCSHGVSRWYKDCGCSTGGQEDWNQNWRAHLRTSLNSLDESIDRIFEQGMARLSRTDPWTVRNDYIHVLTSNEEPDTFYKKYSGRKTSTADRNHFFRLLEGQKYKMLMYTSCGWFFADISGVEPLQNLMYAARLMELYAPFYSSSPENTLLEHLAEARSNIPEKGNAAVLYTGEKIIRKKDLFITALSMIVRNSYGMAVQDDGFLKGKILKNPENVLEITNPLTAEKWTIPFRIEGEERLFSGITLYPGEQEQKYSAENLRSSDKLALMKELCLLELESKMTISRKYSGIISQMDQWLRLRLPESEDLVKSVEALLHYALREVTFLMASGNSEAWNCFLDLINRNRIWNISLPEDLNHWLSSVLEEELLNKREIRKELKEDREGLLKKLIIILSVQKEKRQRGISFSLSGRIYEVFAANRTGLAILESAEDETVSELKSLLNLSDSIHFT
ncbi:MULTISPECIES: DUF3536 domain-containing protein [unclassified Oceanispirochaeta]|uniref:DUF3536 domain-containing protein n=1 Tax=unclassified Oceanispirochaeta TaxID=2635722 RepID=UPI000E08ECE7|nr:MULTISPECIES: DUF3536 domain-containing protein [unclassified Oceanispirochaeta]MBF9016129.1 DUF3536 domain-containing protein [Oceanispirochaeta sp. M2]NPD72591.1 DUF3536 domain-containing protein [Oceanispirochaeta sp. M1]RDG31743.1 DUF3536 domain-containing protein [Oceanispirochaeta sp. M1]